MDRYMKLFRRVAGMEIPVHAGYACFFMVLSLFPALVLVLGILRFTALEAADLMVLAAGFLPDALEVPAWELVSGVYRQSPPALLPLSALTALWSAGRGVYGLQRGLDAVYGVEDRRGWLSRRLASAVYTLFFIAALVLTLVLHVFLEGRLVGFFLLAAGQTGLFCAMYVFLPGQRRGFSESLPGALLASGGWMAFSALFSLYVEHFSGLANVYGSVYALALGMLWLYGCVSILFYGGVLNRYLAGEM